MSRGRSYILHPSTASKGEHKRSAREPHIAEVRYLECTGSDAVGLLHA